MKNKSSGTAKILRKIKSRMSSFSKKQVGSQAPLRFHPSIRGENIRISNSGSVARRVDSFCKGIVFSNRPVQVNEYVLVRFAEVSTTWNGLLRFGFTNQNPKIHQDGLPKYACPDLTNRPGHWAKPLVGQTVKKDSVLFYYVTEEGDVHYGINGQEKGVIFSGVKTKKPLWALIDIYGNTTAVQLLDPVTQMCVVNEKSVVKNDCSSNYCVNSRLTPPAPIRNVHDRNISVANELQTASQNYQLQTELPLRNGEQLVIKVLENGALAFGLTSCNPPINFQNTATVKSAGLR